MNKDMQWRGVARKILQYRKKGICNCISIIILYLINEFALKKIGIPIISKFMNCYYNDLLAIPLYFEMMNLVIGARIINFKLICIITVCASIWWEVLTPMYKKGSIFDWIDILMYIMGAMIYYGYSNNMLKNSERQLNKELLKEWIWHKKIR